MEGNYRGAALGSLLSRNCIACITPKEKRHRISMLGSLAHRYQLCGPYEHCLHEHVKIVNRRREVEAAHSGTIEFKIQSAQDGRKQLDKDLTKLGHELIHMLQHISDIEAKMTAELNGIVLAHSPRARVLIKLVDNPGPSQTPGETTHSQSSVTASS